MTKKLEETLGLPSLEEALAKFGDITEDDIEEYEDELSDIQEQTTNAVQPKELEEVVERSQSLEKIFSELVRDNHDYEMDDISKKALESYETLFDFGMNVNPAHAGKIFENAAQMLRLSLEARNAKSDKKLRVMRLALDKLRIENMVNPKEEAAALGEELFLVDRNEILRSLKDQKSL